jgi:hypothetical protein
MLDTFARNRNALETLATAHSASNYRIWHIWTVTIPRRSITGRLVWGTVWRRSDKGRWIYKRYVESVEDIERRRAIQTLVAKNKIAR